MLLVASFVALLAADVLYALQVAHATYAFGGPVDAIWMTSYLLIGVAALHPARAIDGRRRRSPAMALLDRNSLSGVVRFHKQAQKSGVRAIIGAEVVGDEGFRYGLLAESRLGYQNLCRLITSMKLRSEKGKAAATEEEFRQYAAGLVCLADGSQPVETLLESMEEIGEDGSHQARQGHQLFHLEGDNVCR